jgi:hypothetical protein
MNNAANFCYSYMGQNPVFLPDIADVFTPLESAEEARALIAVEHGYNPRIKSYNV